jgi:hypothetical protein
MRKNQLGEQGYQDGYWEHQYHYTSTPSSFKGHYQNGEPISYWEWVEHYETGGEILKQFYII